MLRSHAGEIPAHRQAGFYSHDFHLRLLPSAGLRCVAGEPDDAYSDGQVAQRTIEDLRRLKEAGKPFFLACGFVKPHMPFYAPKKYWDLYEREKIGITDNRYRPKDAPKELKGSGEFRAYHLADFEEKSEDFDRMMRHGYMACVSYVGKLKGHWWGVA